MNFYKRNMKKYYAVFGSLIFCVGFLSIYMMLDQASLDTFGGGAMSQREINEIGAKISDLEFSLSRHKDSIKNLRDALRALAKGDDTFQVDTLDLGGIDNVPVKFTNQAVKVDTYRKTEKKQMDVKKPIEIDYGVMDKGDTIYAQVDKNECTFAKTPSGNTANIQMLDVFDKISFDNPNGGVWKQGFEIKYDEKHWNDEPLKVFIVPHSHNDPGWIKTLDKYFQDQTVHILDNMVVKLQENPKMTFMWSEISYLSMWWKRIDEQKKDITRRLIKEGRLEITTGGWVMNDEANTHYYAMIDQLIEGHEWLNDHIGVKPKNGWAIDPFGLSPTMAYILQRMGLENMVIQRAHYTIKKYLAASQNLEFMWRQNWDHGSSTDMFTHLMPFYSYDVPHTCGPDPKVCCQFDFKRLPGGRISCPWKVPPIPITQANVEGRARILLDQYRKKSMLYRSKVVLIPLGDDFRYDKTVEWDNQYSNYMKLMDHMNGRKDWHVEAKFGTLDDYFKALFKTMHTERGNLPQGFQVLSGDFFTYSDRDDHYWSGYFTSRPFYKNLDRVLESHLRAAEIIYSVAAATARQHDSTTFPYNELIQMLHTGRQNLGLFQHHDGITGTAKDHVVVDYGIKLLAAIDNSRRVMMECILFLLTDDKKVFARDINFFDVDEERHSHDSLPDKKIVKVMKEAPSIIILYNSIAQERVELVRIHVSAPNVQVQDSQDEVVASQTNLVWTSKEDSSNDVYELVFLVQLSPLGLKRFTVHDMKEDVSEKHSFSKVEIHYANDNYNGQRGPFEVTSNNGAEDFTIENARITAKFTGSTGLLKSITTKTDLKETSTEVQFVTYGTTIKKDKSGAYLFMPDGDAQPLQTDRPFIRVIRGQLLSEVHVIIDKVSHIVRLPKSAGVDGCSLEIENIVDIRSVRNRELVMRLKSGIENEDKIFYTDLNGFQVQKRKTLSKLPIQGNFYPMVSMAYVEDKTSRLTLHSGQTLASASLQKGWLEVIMDRRLMQDDNRGLQQGVTDNKRTLNKFRLLLERREKGDDTAKTSYPVGYPSLLSHATSLITNHPVYIHTAISQHANEAKILPEFEIFQTPLPCDIHLLNLRTRVDQTKSAVTARDESLVILHRRGFDCSFPGPALMCNTDEGEVTVNQLLKSLQVTYFKQTSLSAMYDGAELAPDAKVTIEPMEINTYKVKLG
ncbi:alpha-mannosidase 2-like [Antedon mediterranea]|uniref:alpha-mannosidase 2-like n=1 Tax=Antedon mediterranea TaxID=105859 RepID=UPI003AF64C34